MKKLSCLCALLVFALLAPYSALAQSAISDELMFSYDELVDSDAALNVDMAQLTGFDANGLTRDGRPPAGRPGHAAPPPRPEPRPAAARPAPPRPAPPPHAHHHYEVHDVVLDAMIATPVPEDDHYTLGYGLRGIGTYVSDTDFGGGVGWYFKIRPVRWISVEFVNDYLFNEYSYDGLLLRVPLYLDLQAHLFDYGNLDVYGLVGGGISLILPDDYYHHRESGVVQGGLQVGGGISFLTSGFEIGFDARYTYEYHRHSGEDQHGVLLSLIIGLAR